jgi:alpha-1,2-mannosyltransferase
MDRALDVLRSGAWLTRERIRLIALAVLIASAAGFLFLVVTANGLVDREGRPLGTDFSSFYAAGTYVLEGSPEAPFDPARQHAREQKLFGEATPFYSWFYPPFFLFVAAALALMPYGAALAVWQAVTLGLYLLTIRAILISSFPSPERGGTARQGVRPEVVRPMTSSSRQGGVNFLKELLTPTRQPAAVDLPLSGGGRLTSSSFWFLLALAFPAVLINVGHGQNGFLTAALLAGGLVALDRRPVLSGVVFGLLAYKPQFGLMIPIALIASGRWRSFLAAGATVALLVIATTIIFGPHEWQAFLDSAAFARVVALEQGDVGWYKMQSSFAWARMWGASIPLAYALQGGFVVALGATLAWLWRSAASEPLKAAALCLAAVLATPFTFDYDMMVLAPAIAFMTADGLARGFGPWEKTMLAALWLTPLVARSVAHVTLIPLGVPAMLALFILLLRRSTNHLAFPMASSSAFLLK